MKTLKLQVGKLFKIVVPAVVIINLLLVILALTSCGGGGGDPTPTPVSKQDEVKAKLTSPTWKMQSVTVDGADKTTLYKDLTLKFTASGFTSTNGGAIWPATGTWTFTSTEATAIKRDDGLEVKLQEVTDASLKLGLTWSKTTLGRVESVSGAHVFSFGK